MQKACFFLFLPVLLEERKNENPITDRGEGSPSAHPSPRSVIGFSFFRSSSRTGRKRKKQAFCIIYRSCTHRNAWHCFYSISLLPAALPPSLLSPWHRARLPIGSRRRWTMLEDTRAGRQTGVTTLPPLALCRSCACPALHHLACDPLTSAAGFCPHIMKELHQLGFTLV